MDKATLWKGAELLGGLAAEYGEDMVIVVHRNGTFQIIGMAIENAVPGEGAPDTANHI